MYIWTRKTTIQYDKVRASVYIGPHSYITYCYVGNEDLCKLMHSPCHVSYFISDPNVYSEEDASRNR